MSDLYATMVLFSGFIGLVIFANKQTIARAHDQLLWKIHNKFPEIAERLEAERRDQEYRQRIRDLEPITTTTPVTVTRDQELLDLRHENAELKRQLNRDGVYRS